MPETKFEIWKTGEYFRGVVRRDRDTQKYYISCEACAGSHRCTEVDTITGKLKRDVIKKIKAFAKRRQFKFKNLTNENQDD
jgi:hypothetical protein